MVRTRIWYDVLTEEPISRSKQRQLAKESYESGMVIGVADIPDVDKNSPMYGAHVHVSNTDTACQGCYGLATDQLQ